MTLESFLMSIGDWLPLAYALTVAVALLFYQNAVVASCGAVLVVHEIISNMLRGPLLSIARGAEWLPGDPPANPIFWYAGWCGLLNIVLFFLRYISRLYPLQRLPGEIAFCMLALMAAHIVAYFDQWLFGKTEIITKVYGYSIPAINITVAWLMLRGLQKKQFREKEF